MEKKIKVMLVSTNGVEFKKIDNTLESLREHIGGGYIEVVPLMDGMVVIVDEEGKLKGLPPVMDVGSDVLCGDIIVCRTDGEDFASLYEDDITEFKEIFGLNEGD